MPVDNQLYDRLAHTWWEDTGLLHLLKALNPARFGYMRRTLFEELRLDPTNLQVLDLGCGGGLLAEEFARLGCAVTGLDPSEPSLVVARGHAATVGLSIDYRHGSGEALPFADAIFEVVYCCDVLEHVADLPQVIAETARVLKASGVFVFDTINRTLRSKFIMIKVFQDWAWTSLLPAGLHDWRLFVRPAELRTLLALNDLELRSCTGLQPRATPLAVLRALRARKRGRLSYAETARQLDLGESRSLSILYAGYAVKGAGGVA
jgi:2-polyprenyl-6-hydroxyphenyl methylase/3-demethylubiquinone-9 3-methyltransferase